ncbi:hematopoietic prostaglandin D synthase-like [Amphiura filiformis]|uniref:hematopoietic prostaglandin D synthase-like n=1 Tax=Amphiura filiformis TaxID=82378 RepID=UPI003B212E4C
MSSSSQISYKLYYFNAYGRAEVLRFLFHLAEVEYEDVRIEFADWTKTKQEMGFKQVPVLEVDGKRLTQSVAITRYLAREFGLYGKDNWECALIDSFVDNCQEIIEKAIVIIKTFEPEQRKKEIEKLQADVPKEFEELEKLVGDNNYFIGDQITVADLFFYNTVSIVSQFASNFLQTCPKLEALRSKVEAHPRVADWLHKRPATSYTG